MFACRMCKSLYVLLTLCLIVLAHIPAYAQTLESDAHPCHYIILVDASRSTLSKTTKANYRTALQEVLISQLYEKGFGEAIPPFEPKEDALTLLTFGVVVKSATPAYLDLRNYDLSSQFIHTILLRRPGVNTNELRRMVIPADFYEFTVLSWAKQMALWSLQSQLANTINQRTFLILISDGVANENSLTAETNMMAQWADPGNLKKVGEIVNRVDQAYQFTNGYGATGKAWGERVQINEEGNDLPVFVEAYEIQPTVRLALEDEARKLNPFRQVDFSWDEESGNHPVGTLRVEVTDQFINWLQTNQSYNGQLALERGSEKNTTPWNLSNKTNLSTTLTGPLDCEQKTYQALIEVPLTRNDDILGISTFRYRYSHSVISPLPFTCTLASSFWSWLKKLVGAALVAIVCYWVYYRFFRTHIKVELPGMAIRIPIERRGGMKRDTLIPPAPGLEAFSLLLPKKWVQIIFYQRANLTVQVNHGIKLELPSVVKDMTIQFPIAETRLAALWNEVKDAPTDVKLTFHQGRQSFDVNLSYPGGA